MVFLVVSQMIVKGLLYRVTMTSMLPIFKNLGIGAADLQTIMTVAMSPWTIKPVVGILSDILTFGGYHKRWWLVQGTLVGMLAAVLMFPTSTLPLWLLLCYVGLNYEMAIIDLLTEGKYAATMQEYPESGSDLITFVSGLQTAGSIVAMTFVGHVADKKAFNVLFGVSVGAAVLPMIPSLLGWLPEEKVRTRRCIAVDRGLFTRNRAMFIVILYTGLAGPVIALLSVFTTRAVGLVGAVLILSASVSGSYLAFPRVIANIGLYQVLSRLSRLSMSTALDYFFTATPECLVDGPHFSFKYYITYTGLVSSCIAMVAVWVYQAFLSRWRFRSVLIFTTALVGLGGLSDLRYSVAPQQTPRSLRPCVVYDWGGSV